jgi:phospholipase/carboxylesterase
MSLRALTREPAGEPEGALVLFHGRGADEHDLVPLLDVLDPERRLLGLTPRGPLSLPPGGAHWYVVPRVGYPDTETFHESYRLASEWLDALPVPLDQTVLGGFSQGAVMSFALGLGSDRPRPAGIVAFSGFVPTVDGWEPDYAGAPPVAIGHGTYDPIIPVEFGRQARAALEAAGADVTYRESPLPHAIDPRYAAELAGWVEQRLRPAPAAR